MSNYPPGTSAGDPNAPWNAPDHSHDHEWWDLDGPMFEDGAAIFMESCQYSEGRHGDGWSCESIRETRCEVERIIKSRSDGPDVAYLASEEEPNQKLEHIEVVFETAFELLQMTPDEARDIRQVDPPNDYGDGYVEVCVGDYTIIYKQQN